MGHIVANEELESRLRGFVEPVEIRDVEGRVLGTFTPQVSPEQREAYEKARSLFDLAEADRRSAACKAGQKRTSEQVLQRLQNLERGE
jgi:hypothetical protein